MERSEIRVTVGGEVCIERSSEEDDSNTTVGAIATIQHSCKAFYFTQYICAPPDELLNDAPVVV